MLNSSRREKSDVPNPAFFSLCTSAYLSRSTYGTPSLSQACCLSRYTSGCLLPSRPSLGGFVIIWRPVKLERTWCFTGYGKGLACVAEGGANQVRGGILAGCVYAFG